MEWLGGPMGGPWRRADFETDPDWEWHTAAADTPEDLYALWRGAIERSRVAWAEALAADGGLDRPADFAVETGESPNLRRGLVDLHDEYARHVGHADLLREAVDGLTGEDPPQPALSHPWAARSRPHGFAQLPARSGRQLPAQPLRLPRAERSLDLPAPVRPSPPTR